ncbi:MAG: hypothetical protein F6J97_07285 [Leptolyngbya sp. SIO4C1]|nr:hypothetical protein [Leptolyngbya sp. SIO4C1]
MVNSPSQNTDNEAEVTFPIVGIGASAGGLEAYSDLLQALPIDTGMVFVLIQHLSPDSPSMLSEILSRVTEMPVVEATQDLQVQPNHIYIIPANARMTIEDDRLQLAPREASQQKFMPIDVFFKSLSSRYRNRAIGIVLSGLDGDGAAGLKTIKQAAGITFAQTENTAQYSDMPNTAVETGYVDFILPPAEIAHKLASIAQHPYLTDDSEQPPQSPTGEPPRETGLPLVYSLLKTATGVDFTQYKRTTFERRLRRRMALYRLNTIEAYAERLQNDPAEVKALYRDVLITVTSFFRDPETFVFLKESIFPSLIEQREPMPLFACG